MSAYSDYEAAMVGTDDLSETPIFFAANSTTKLKINTLIKTPQNDFCGVPILDSVKNKQSGMVTNIKRHRYRLRENELTDTSQNQ